MFRYSTSLKSKINRASSLLLFCTLVACSPNKVQEEIKVESESNPAAEGFDSINSDKKAIAWADAAMNAMGGRKKWDQTRFISWNFFNRRDLVWDKKTGRVRIDAPGDSAIYLLNINDNTGTVLLKNRIVENADSIKTLLDRAKSIWINDSYWLVMPFKLKDSGVTLKYLREDLTLNGDSSTVLELTFNAVGVTPDNKYEVYITKSDSLVKQWAYFSLASQDSASVIWPWDNYKEFNGLLISSDRSDDKGPHKVEIFRELSDEVFEKFDRNP